jgi:hypothetical protein
VTEHGRTMWMSHGCRCNVCHRALLDYSRVRDAVRAVAEGRQPRARVPAHPVRRRVRRLRAAGWSVQAIADAAGVSHTTVDRIANARLRNVTLSTARAVLAVEP